MHRARLLHIRLNAAAILLCLGLAATARAQQLASAGDLTSLSLNELLNIEVTSVSRHAEPLADSAAAVYVLTGDEIRRSGAHSIAEALRLVPGLDVAQVNNNTWAITARGFNQIDEDKLEVRLDGRSVYTPLFSGVFWDVLDTYLDDIDRIEVIRGPGGTLWGANAVNGVINIITRSARDTQGTAGRVAGGNTEPYYGAARSGFAVGSSGAARIYAQAYGLDDTRTPAGANAVDGRHFAQAGFRSDWGLSGMQDLTVSGDAYRGQERTGIGNESISGANLLEHWSGHGAGGSEWALQSYFDNSAREVPGAFGETLNTVDLDFQQRFRLGRGNDLLYGLGYRYSHDDTAAAPAVINFVPSRRTLQTPSAFVEDQYAASDRLTITLGSKFEHNSFTGFEMQPSLRAGWRVSEALFTWAAVSRAVRTPDRVDRDVAAFFPPNIEIRIGNPDTSSERLVAYEWGLRLWPQQALLLDFAAFYNRYSKLISVENLPLPVYGNKIDGHSAGAELSALWRVRDGLDLRLFYDWLYVRASPRADSTDVTSQVTLEGSDPRHQGGLRLSLQPAPRWQAEAFLRYVDRLPGQVAGGGGIPAYAELGLRGAWRIDPRLELALLGGNLLQDRHLEFGSSSTQAANELRRSLMLELNWSWR